MSTERPKKHIRLRNGDVLITATRARDPEVDAAFKAALNGLRERNAARILAFQQARHRAA